MIRDDQAPDSYRTATSGAPLQIRVSSWSGNVRPWRAEIHTAAGAFVARSGFCATKMAAIRSGEEIAVKIPAARIAECEKIHADLVARRAAFSEVTPATQMERESGLVERAERPQDFRS